MQWWRASKGQGPNYGCRITISSNPVPVLNTGPSLITEVYSGALPRNATAPEVAEWSRSLLGEQVQIPGVALACYLGFGTDRINLGDVAAGVVKSFIDCLYSIWGGAVGRPSDHRIDELTVAKGVEGITPDSVMVRVWRLQRIVSTGPQDRFTPYRPDGRKDEPPVSEDTQRPGPREAITNPYRPGTSKYIVCEGALAGWSAEKILSRIEANRPGSSRKLSDYISDLRYENRLAVGRDDRVLWCRGRIHKNWAQIGSTRRHPTGAQPYLGFSWRRP